MAYRQAVVVPYIQGQPTKAFNLETQGFDLLEFLTAMIEAGADHLEHSQPTINMRLSHVVIGLLVTVVPSKPPSSIGLHEMQLSPQP